MVGNAGDQEGTSTILELLGRAAHPDSGAAVDGGLPGWTDTAPLAKYLAPGPTPAGAALGTDFSGLPQVLKAVAPHLAAGGAPRAAAPVAGPSDLQVPGPARDDLPEPPKPIHRDPLLAVDVLNPMMALAMIGSLFTRRPAVAAGNAAAAAMAAQTKGDHDAYAEKLAEYKEHLTKAHIENQADVADYRAELANKKISLTERLANLRGRAVRRGDNAMLMSLDAGTDPWVAIEQRERAGEIISPKLEKAAFIKSWLSKPENEEATVQDANVAYDLYKKGGKAPTAQTKAKLEAQAIEENFAAHAGDPDWTMAKSIAEVKAQSTPVKGEKPLTMAQEGAADIEARIKRLQAENPGMSEAEARSKAIADFKAAGRAPPKGPAGMTGNQAVKEKHLENQITEQLDVVDKVMGTLQKYRMAAGAAGYVTRGGEIVGNISGVDLGTDREQFRRDVEFLRMMFPRIIASGGRPLAGEQKRVDAIIGGLSMGDTTANTMRSLEELQKIYMRRLQEQREILGNPGGTPSPSSPPGSTPPLTPPGGGVDWDSYGKAP